MMNSPALKAVIVASMLSKVGVIMIMVAAGFE